jgi:spermidine/putrescine ABC transporter ATP-binding subunit
VEGNVSNTTGQLQINGVTKRFGSQIAIDRVTLDIPHGKFVTLLGPSGCGKTTLLRMIAGFYEPDAGTITLDGSRIDQLPPHQRSTAMVFQDYALFPHLTVRDNVGYGLRLAKVARTEIQRRVHETLDFLGLGSLGDRWPNQLSGGQQQRVALARALIVEPKVLLLDEPLSNLDANFRERMRWELRSLQQRLNITFLYVTHDQNEALAMSDWVAVMNAGRVEQWGTPREIYHAPEGAFVATFIGTANLREVMILKREREHVVISLADKTISVPTSEASSTNERALLCIRPEAITISHSRHDELFINLDGRVTRFAFLGHMTRYWIDVAGEEWIVDQPDLGSAAIPYEGDVVLSFQPQQVHIISTP